MMSSYCRSFSLSLLYMYNKFFNRYVTPHIKKSSISSPAASLSQLFQTFCNPNGIPSACLIWRQGSIDHQHWPDRRKNNLFIMIHFSTWLSTPLCQELLAAFSTWTPSGSLETFDFFPLPAFDLGRDHQDYSWQQAKSSSGWPQTFEAGSWFPWEEPRPSAAQRQPFLLSGEGFASGNLYRTLGAVDYIYCKDKSFLSSTVKVGIIHLETHSYPTKKNAGQ